MRESHTSDDVMLDVSAGRSGRWAGMRVALMRDRGRIALGVAALTAAAIIASSLVPPRYEAEAQLLVSFAETGGGGDAMAAQAAIIASPAVLERAGDELHLDDRPGFAARSSWLDRALAAIGLGSDPAGEGGKAVDWLRTGLEVRALDRAGLIAVDFSSPDASLSAAVANAVADRYVVLQQAVREQADPRAANALAAAVATARQEVARLDDRLAGLRKARDARQAQVAANRPAELEAELARLAAQRLAADERVKALRAALADAAALRQNPDVQASDTIAPLLEREAQLRGEIADLSVTLLGNHPRIRALKAQLADTRGQVAAAARAILSGIEDDARALATQVGKAAAERDEISAAADEAAARDAEIAATEARSAQARRQLDDMLARQRDAAGIGGEFLPAEARVFQRATVPARAASTSLPAVAALAFAGSMLLMLGWTVLRARAGDLAGKDEADAVHHVDEIEMPAPVRPVEADAPQPTLRELLSGRARLAELASPAAAFPEPASPVRRTIGEIGVASAAEKLIAGGATRAIFLSPEGDAGAAASVQVAREVANAGLRVVLLDLTASGAASRPMLGAARSGITDLLVSGAQFGDIIHNDRATACHVIPVGTADPARAMRAAERLPIILESLASAYDLIVVECGAADVESVGRLVADDTALLVSAVEPSDMVAELALDIAGRGLGSPIIVAAQPSPPRSDRSAA